MYIQYIFRGAGNTADFFKKNRSAWLWVVLTMFFAPLAPEYLAPGFTIGAGFVLLHKKRRERTRLVTNNSLGLAIPLLCLVAWQMVGLIYSEYTLSGVAIVALALFGLSSYWVAAELCDSEMRLDSVLYAGALSGGVCGAIGIVQFILYRLGAAYDSRLMYLINPFWHRLDMLVAKLAVGYLLPDSVVGAMPRTEFIAIEERASGTFTNPIFFAVFLVLVLPFAMYCAFWFKGVRRRVISAGCAALILGGIAVSYSRGPYVAAGMAVACLMFWGGKRALAILGVCAGAGLGAALVFRDIIARLFTLFDSGETSVNIHMKIYRAALDTIGDNRLLGLGTGTANFGEVLREKYGIDQPHAHNVFLEFFVENGVLGAGLFTAVIVLFFVFVIRAARRGGKCRALSVTMCASMAGMLVCMSSDNIFYGLKPVQLVMLLLGISAGFARWAKNGTPGKDVKASYHSADTAEANARDCEMSVYP